MTRPASRIEARPVERMGDRADEPPDGAARQPRVGIERDHVADVRRRRRRRPSGRQDARVVAPRSSAFSSSSLPRLRSQPTTATLTSGTFRPMAGLGNKSPASAPAAFTVSSSAGAATLASPTLSSPAEGTILSSNATPTYQWSAVPGATGYDLYISYGQDSQLTSSGTTPKVTVYGAISGTSYQPVGRFHSLLEEWSVRASDDAGSGATHRCRCTTPSGSPPPPP